MDQYSVFTGDTKGWLILDEDELFATAGDLRKRGIYKNNFGLSLQAGLEISRSIGKGGEVFTGIRYRHGLTSLSGTGTGFKQRYSSLGIKLGWRF